MLGDNPPASTRRVSPARVLIHVVVALGKWNEPPPKPAIVQVYRLKALLFQTTDGLERLVNDHPLVVGELADLEMARLGTTGEVPRDRHLALRGRLGHVEP